MSSDKKSRVDLSLLTTCDIKRSISFTAREKLELLKLLKCSYPSFTLDNIFEPYPVFHQHYVMRMRFNNTLIASRQFLVVGNLSHAPQWAIEMSDALQLDHFAVGSRAIVHPYLRGNGLGASLVKKVNHEIYSRHGVNTIFGSSSNLAAIALYLRQGAKLWPGDVKNLYHDKPTSIYPESVKTLFNNCKPYATRLPTPMRYLYRNDYRHITENINHLPAGATRFNSAF